MTDERKAEIRDRVMFGCQEQDLRDLVARDFYSSPAFLAVSILSDAQEVLSFGNAEKARQFINRAKWVILNHCAPVESEN